MYQDLREAERKGSGSDGLSGFCHRGAQRGRAEIDDDRVFSKGTLPLLPEQAPRYLMGVGTPEDILDAVMLGVDFFDCVLPTRNARNGTLFTSAGKISIKQAQYAEDKKPVDESAPVTPVVIIPGLIFAIFTWPRRSCLRG